MDHKAHQVKVNNMIADVRSHVKDMEILTDRWPVKTDHKQKIRDLRNIMKTVSAELDVLETELTPKT